MSFTEKDLQELINAFRRIDPKPNCLGFEIELAPGVYAVSDASGNLGCLYGDGFRAKMRELSDGITCSGTPIKIW